MTLCAFVSSPDRGQVAGMVVFGGHITVSAFGCIRGFGQSRRNRWEAKCFAIGRRPAAAFQPQLPEPGVKIDTLVRIRIRGSGAGETGECSRSLRRSRSD